MAHLQIYRSYICIYVCMAQEMYADDQRVWNRLFEMIATDLAEAEKGIDLGRMHGVVYPIVLGNKGDWSYLAPWFYDSTNSFGM